MIYSYFPGCTLKDRAKELDRYGRASAKALGIELKELPEWQCCGAIYPQASDEIASRLSCVRALKNAEEGRLVTLCSACHHVIKRTNYDWNHDENFREKASNYMKPETPYDGGTKVTHLLEVLRDEVGFDELKKKVTHPLTGRKIGAFYGCMVLRPGKELAFDDPENPKIFEDFIRALGAEPVKYAYRNECCGAYVALEDKGSANAQVNRALDSASRQAPRNGHGVPAVPVQSVENATGDKLPVKYFTETARRSAGVRRVSRWTM
jgi:heterodisulfide reductase subunit B